MRSSFHSKWFCLCVVMLLRLAVGCMLPTPSCHAQGAIAAPPWHMLETVLARIKAPAFADRDFDVTKYGAVEGGNADCRQAFAEAIAACHDAGGGRVVIPRGKWLAAGPIHLKSNVNLHVSDGAHVMFSTKASDYLPIVLARFEGTEVMNYSPLIYALDQENIAITGKGTLDGRASAKDWWSWKAGGSNGDAGKLIKMADDGVPPEKRIFGEGFQLRVNFIQPYRCQNVLIEDVQIIGSPMWEINPVLCNNVTVRGVTIDSHGPNNDGCNPESCNGVLIENCTFDTGDDCIAIKSGRNADGRRINVPSENIVVRRCTMKDGHGGVTLGSEMSGGIRNVFVEDCSMSSPNLDRAIRLKSNTRRGGYLENLFVRNIEVGEVKQAVLHIDLRYFKEIGEHVPTVRNIFLENVRSKKSEYPLFFLGIPESPIENVVITNCRFENAKRPSLIEHVETLVLKNVTQPQ